MKPSEECEATVQVGSNYGRNNKREGVRLEGICDCKS